MPTTRECPLCGASMQLKQTQQTVQLPGRSNPGVRTAGEWVCPDCDYFEEAEEEVTSGT